MPKKPTEQFEITNEVLCFTAAKGGLQAEAPIRKPTPAEALRLGERLKAHKRGVLVYQRRIDTVTDEADNAVILARHGVVPNGVEEALGC